MTTRPTGATPPDPVHPDLRRIAPWLPRGPIGPRSIGVIRALGGLDHDRFVGAAAEDEHSQARASARSARAKVLPWGP